MVDHDVRKDLDAVLVIDGDQIAQLRFTSVARVKVVVIAWQVALVSTRRRKHR